MERASFKDMPCSVAQCLEVVGEWWTLLIIRDAFLGVRTFVAFQSSLGISRNVLTQRLNHLVEEDIMEKVLYQERPARYEYRLTEKGQDLWAVLTAMRQWGDRWAAPDGPPIEFVHKACEHTADVVPTCGHCGEQVGPGTLRVVAASAQRRAGAAR